MAEVPVQIDGRRLTLSNLDKVLYPEAGLTKAGVVDYYARIAGVMVPHLAGRAVTLVRYPDGVDGPSFFEKRCPGHRPPWVPVVGELSQCSIDEPAALVWLANLAALELHTLQARASEPDRPTSVVFDLDPGPPADVLDAARAALDLRAMLAELGLECVVKTSGSKGLHLAVPLNTPVTADATKEFSHALGRLLARQAPDRVVVTMPRKARVGRVFVDWSQNDHHKTTVCVYSLRALPRPNVSTPLAWNEVSEAVASGDRATLTFEIDDVLDRVERHGDLYAANLTVEQTMPAGA